ncbi:hypothetical protein EDD36DRAFT_211316 [Exophiala viscosa]|uniref:Uncharacterized protein n=1 Tax=Exophiala viscosa TaxID=2486360 RepID=A0AAN6IDJ7_9EURO|nr:hypothetical protein EDD36DRAFT_211316 [Exophiala viscosa]
MRRKGMCLGFYLCCQSFCVGSLAAPHLLVGSLWLSPFWHEAVVPVLARSSSTARRIRPGGTETLLHLCSALGLSESLHDTESAYGTDRESIHGLRRQSSLKRNTGAFHSHFSIHKEVKMTENFLF